MSRVFVIQNHLRYDSAKGELVPRYDINPAREFGEIVFVLPPRTTMNEPARVIGVITEALRDFCDDDHLLLIGNPCFIGWAVAIAASRNSGRVRTLVWSSNRYASVAATLPVRATKVSS